ncbi:MAG: aldo/keto reductase [Nitrospirae bacterium]|nr:MAG: aldo/keto reductase [Nitrospirota bacterium]
MVFTTYNQIDIPAIMYGTAWKKQATKALVEQAVLTGFRAIDTANQLIHYDEALVGEALLSLARQGIRRDQLFLQTKFTPLSGQDHRTPYDPRADLTTQVNQSFESSLGHLHTDYLDSYLLHGPYSRFGLGAEDWEVWQALEALYRAGRTRMIGISNVTAQQLQHLCDRAEVKPMVVQNRCYAVLGWDRDVREVCRSREIVYQGFSLLTANQAVVQSPYVRGIASRLGATPEQIVFRFALQLGILPLSGTTNMQHMKDDLAVLDGFALAPDEVRQIETLAV